jgi:DNA-binding FadR family transcriptional regulator
MIGSFLLRSGSMQPKRSSHRPSKKSILRASDAASRAARNPRHRAVELRIPKTAELIADHIRKMIIRGEVKDGDFLESQGQLIDSYAVSRPIVREAFRILEAEELISIQRGSRTGARVHRPKPDVVARQAGLMLQAQGTTLADVEQARLAVEPWAARLVARRRSPEDVDRLRKAVRVAHDSIADAPRYSAAVTAFHQLVVELSGNRTLTLLIKILRGILQRHEARLTARINETSSLQERRKRILPALKSFEKLIRFIEAGDADGAEKHWRLHMENVGKVWADDRRSTVPIDLLD